MAPKTGPRLLSGFLGGATRASARERPGRGQVDHSRNDERSRFGLTKGERALTHARDER